MISKHNSVPKLGLLGQPLPSSLTAEVSCLYPGMDSDDCSNLIPSDVLQDSPLSERGSSSSENRASMPSIAELNNCNPVSSLEMLPSFSPSLSSATSNCSTALEILRQVTSGMICEGHSPSQLSQLNAKRNALPVYRLHPEELDDVPEYVSPVHESKSTTVSSQLDTGKSRSMVGPSPLSELSSPGVFGDYPSMLSQRLVAQNLFSGTLTAQELTLLNSSEKRPSPYDLCRGPRGSSSSSGGTTPASEAQLTTQKAVAFHAGPKESIQVLGNPVEHCPRCHREGLCVTSWRPHRHIGELKIRYICERHIDDLNSLHHFDIPLCPICNQVLYLYEFNTILGASNARRLHKFVLKCANRHVLPLLDLFCQTKRGGEKCNANLKLQWSYGTMVKRCELQKNRDHDLWWVRYKNEWKQRRTIIRYKKDFLSHLTDAQRSLLLGLGLEGETPPDPRTALGRTFDVLVAASNGTAGSPKLRKRAPEKFSAARQFSEHRVEGYEASMGSQAIRSLVPSNFNVTFDEYRNRVDSELPSEKEERSCHSESGSRENSDTFVNIMGSSLYPRKVHREEEGQPVLYFTQVNCKYKSNPSNDCDAEGRSGFRAGLTPTTDPNFLIPPHLVVTGTPTSPLPSLANGFLSVEARVIGDVISSAIPV